MSIIKENLKKQENQEKNLLNYYEKQIYYFSHDDFHDEMNQIDQLNL
jgi:spore coat protein CotF